MASYEQVLKFENETPQGVIRLVESNGFYRAYNHSAYLFHQAIAQHKVTRKFIKDINQDFVYVGFPVDKLLERIGEHSHKKTDFGFDEELSDVECPDDAQYDEWRRTIPTEVASRGDVNSLSPRSDELYRAVCERIRVYPMEAKSLIKCMSFLADLYPAYLAARRHTRGKGYHVRSEMNQEHELVKLRDELAERRYKPRPSSCFIIHDPKMREVFAADFRDRIVHHLFHDYTHEIFERTFIADSYSCIAGRGTHFGIERLKHHIRSCTKLFSNVYLGMLDDFIKRELKGEHDGRYVDDMFIVGETKEHVKSSIEPIHTFLRDKLHLEPSENKTRVCNVFYRVEFLGAFIKPYRNYVAFRSLRRIRGHLHLVNPHTSRSMARAVVNSSLGVLSHYDSYNVRTVRLAKSYLTRVGRFSEDGLRYYPDPVAWEIYRLKRGGKK